MLQVMPDPFVGVQVRRVAWEPHQLDPLRTPFREKLLYELASMDRSSIPHDEHLPLDMSRKMPEKLYDIRAGEGMVLDLHEQTTARRNAADDRQVVASQRTPQYRRFSRWSVSANHPRQQVGS